MGIYAGARLDATDFLLPDEVVVSAGSVSNTITSTDVFADLPTPLVAEIINPHPTYEMLMLITVGAWLYDSTGTAGVRAALKVTGTLNLEPGVAGVAKGWGEVIKSAAPQSGLCQAVSRLRLPPTQPGDTTRKATFTLQAFRSGSSGTQRVDYPVVSLIPLRYIATQ